MGDFIGIAIFMAFWGVMAGLATALSRWTYKKVSDGRSYDDDERAKDIDDTARVLGLTPLGPASRTVITRAVFEGERGGFFVRLEEAGHLGGGLKVTIAARGDRGSAIPLTIGIGPRDPDRKEDREPGRDGAPVTGDEEFDRRIRLAGDPAQIAALMDQMTRWSIRSLGSGSGRVIVVQEYPRSVTSLGGGSTLRSEGGRLIAELPGPLANISRVKAELDQLLTLAGRLSVPAGELENRLAHNALQDPDPSVRVRVLDVLGSRAATHPESRATLRSALRDASPQIRFHAATALGDEGLPVLEELVYLPSPHEDVAVQALERLSRHATPGRFLLLLKSALAGPDGRRRLAALRGLARLGGRMTEQEALAILDSELPEVCRASLAALAEVGTAAAVAPLHALIATRPLDLPLRTAVQQAIAEIQGRLPGAAAGQVALAPSAGDAAGRVNLAGDERAGRVALPEDGA